MPRLTQPLIFIDILPLCEHSEIAAIIANAEDLGDLYCPSLESIPQRLEWLTDGRSALLDAVEFVSYDALLYKGVLSGPELMRLKGASKASGALLVRRAHSSTETKS